MVTSGVESLGDFCCCGLCRRRLGRCLSNRVDVFAGQQVRVDLTKGNRERLLLHVGLDQRADVLKQTLTELRVVGVDLTSTLGAVKNQLVLAVGLFEQIVDGGVGHALGGDGWCSHSQVPNYWDQLIIKATKCSAAS